MPNKIKHHKNGAKIGLKNSYKCEKKLFNKFFGHLNLAQIELGLWGAEQKIGRRRQNVGDRNQDGAEADPLGTIACKIGGKIVFRKISDLKI